MMMLMLMMMMMMMLMLMLMMMMMMMIMIMIMMMMEDGFDCRIPAQAGDILLAIDDVPLAEDGSIPFREAERIGCPGHLLLPFPPLKETYDFGPTANSLMNMQFGCQKSTTIIVLPDVFHPKQIDR